MWSHFSFAAGAVVPILLLILLGYVLRRINFLNDIFLKTGNKLVFYVLLPCMLFYNVYSVDSITEIDWRAVLYSSLVILTLFLLGLLAVWILIPDRKQKGVVLQGLFRSNSALIGIPLASALGGTSGVVMVSVMSVVAIPLFNILGVLSLTMFLTDEDGGKKRIDWGKVFHKIVTNPLIIGIFLGLLFLVIRYFIPQDADGLPVFAFSRQLKWVCDAVVTLSRCATPMALIVLGGNFRFQAIAGMKKQILTGTLGRLIVAPLLGIGAAVLLSRLGILNLTPGHYAAFVAMFASPCAVASAVMASEMNNDEQLAAQLVVWTSVLSMLTIFVIVLLLRIFGLL